MLALAVVAAAAMALVPAARATHSEPVTRINRGSLGSSPDEITDAGGTAVFSATTLAAGAELGLSDGTEGGTELLDLRPGTAASNPQELTAVGGTVFFTADDGTNGRELWRSDGTAAGTELVADINAGSGSSSPAELTAVGGHVYFRAFEPAGGSELWRSDGTAAGTEMVANTVSGAGSSFPQRLVDVNGTLMFSARDALWKSNGTEAGTVEVFPATEAWMYISLVNVGGTVYFVARTRDCSCSNSWRLYKSNGTTAGTQELDVPFNYTNSAPNQLTAMGGLLFFSHDGFDGHGRELWRTDGTLAGTQRLEVNPTGSASPQELTAIGGTLFFAASDGTTGEELWKTNGTVAGTQRVSDINMAGSSTPSELTDVGGTLFLTANDGSGTELWRSNGTVATTAKLATPASSERHLANVDGALFFNGSTPGAGAELWRSGGSAASTELVADLEPAGSSFPGGLTRLGGMVVFNANDGEHGIELWRTDGTESGTALVKDIWPGSASGNPSGVTAAGAHVFFRANDGSTGFELYASDGTEAGTRLIDINPGPGHSMVSPRIVEFDGMAYFVANDGVHGDELWRSDGTLAGTELVKDVNPGAQGSSPSEFAVMGGVLHFGAWDGANGRELWRTDGTAAGTEMAADINPGAGSSSPSAIAAGGGRLYFGANEGAGDGPELWTSDGTAAGTEQVKDINPGSGGSTPLLFTAAGGSVYFVADDGTHGRELWRTDGTAAGTELVEDIHPTGWSFPSELTAFGDRVAFRASHGAGASLWMAGGDGAEEVGASNLNPASLVVSGDMLLFRGAPDQEIWRSDGTDAGTVLLDEVNPSGSANAAGLTLLGDLLLFRAFEPSVGTELWRLELDLTPPDPPTLTGTDPDSPSNDGTPLVQGGAEAGSTVRIYAGADCSGTPLAAGPAADFSGAGIEVTVPEDATTALRATATDAGGNTSDCSSDSVAYTHDGTEPDTSIDAGPSGPTNDATPTFEFSSGEAGSTFECRIHPDGDPAPAFGACSDGGEHTPAADLPDGDHVFEVRATDPAGNPDASPASRGLTVDATAPDAPALSGTDPASPSNDGTPLVQGGAEAGSTVRIYASADCSGAPVATGTAAALAGAGIEVTVPEDATTSLRATATDALENTSDCSAPLGYTHDGMPPATSIDAGPSGPTNDATPTFELSSGEPGSSFECRLYADGDPAPAFGACSDGDSHTPGSALADGDHVFEARAIDAAGNADASAERREFTLDTAAPDLPSLSGTVPASPSSDATPLVQGEAEDGSTVRLHTSADCSGAPLATGPADELDGAGIEVTVPEDATTTLRATATDAAGNTSGCSDPLAYTEDSTDPGTDVDSGPVGPTNDATPTFELSSDEAGVEFECRLHPDGDPAPAFGACSDGDSHTPDPALVDGDHVFEARAIDAAGNTDASPTRREFTVDTAAPDEPTLSGTDPDSPADDATPLIRGDAEAGSTVRLYTSADCSGAAVGTGPVSTFQGAGIEVTVPEDATTTLRATATDAAGTASGCSAASVAYTEDSTPPDTQVDTGPAGLTNDATPTFELSSGEPGSSFECRLYADGDPAPAFGACSDGDSHTPDAALADGDHVFEARATDAAGHTDPAPASRGFTVDATAPAAPALSETDPASPSSDDTPMVKGAAEDGSTVRLHTSADCSGASVATGTAAELGGAGIEVTVPADATTSLRATATDAAGNTSGCSDPLAYTHDGTEPDTSIDAGPSGATNDATPTFELSSGEPGSSFECRLYADGDPAPAFGACSDGDAHTADPPLGDGDHVFEARTTDPAGNTDTSPARSEFTLDTAAPDLPTLSGTDPASPSSDRTPRVQGEAEDGSTVRLHTSADCSGAPLATGPADELDGAGVEATVPEDATTSLRATATDAAGNSSGCSDPLAYTHDGTAPETAIDAGPDGATADTTPTFEFSSAEPGAGFRVPHRRRRVRRLLLAPHRPGARRRPAHVRGPRDRCRRQHRSGREPRLLGRHRRSRRARVHPHASRLTRERQHAAPEGPCGRDGSHLHVARLLRQPGGQRSLVRLRVRRIASARAGQLADDVPRDGDRSSRQHVRMLGQRDRVRRGFGAAAHRHEGRAAAVDAGRDPGLQADVAGAGRELPLRRRLPCAALRERPADRAEAA